MPPPAILQVDDEPMDAILLGSVFAGLGVTNPLHVVNDGQEAMDYLAGVAQYADRSSYPIPGLILLDLKMPKKSGFDVLRWLRERPEFRSIVVVVLSSSAFPSDVREAYNLGANSFIEKPVAYEKAQEMGRALKAWWIDLNQFAQGS